MSQNYEMSKALALLDELSTKSSESGLSEDTCQALFGGPCPEALRKKNTKKSVRQSNEKNSNKPKTNETHSTNEGNQQPINVNENYTKRNDINTHVNHLKQLSSNLNIKENSNKDSSNKLNKTKFLNNDSTISNPSKEHRKYLSDTYKALKTLNKSSAELVNPLKEQVLDKNENVLKGHKGNDLTKDKNVDITDPSKGHFNEINTTKNSINLNNDDMNLIKHNSYQKVSPLTSNFNAERDLNESKYVINIDTSLISLPKEHNFHKEDEKNMPQNVQKTPLLKHQKTNPVQYVVSNHKNNAPNGNNHKIIGANPINADKVLTIRNDESINKALPFKRSIGSGDYALPVNKTQQTSTDSTLNSVDLNKSTTLSSDIKDTSGSESERTYEDTGESSISDCICQSRRYLGCKSHTEDPVTNIKHVPNIINAHHCKKSFTLTYFPPNQPERNKKLRNKAAQTSKIILDKRIIYSETEYPNIHKETSQEKEYNNNDIKGYIDKETFNYKNHKIPLRYPESFSNSISPLVSSSSTCDQDIFKQSSSNDACFEHLRIHLTNRGKVREVVNKLENKQKFIGRCCKQIQNRSFHLPTNKVQANNYNVFQGDEIEYPHGIYHQCNKYY